MGESTYTGPLVGLALALVGAVLCMVFVPAPLGLAGVVVAALIIFAMAKWMAAISRERLLPKLRTLIQPGLADCWARTPHPFRDSFLTPDKLSAFLGVPAINSAMGHGPLVLQYRVVARFDKGERDEEDPEDPEDVFLVLILQMQNDRYFASGMTLLSTWDTPNSALSRAFKDLQNDWRKKKTL